MALFVLYADDDLALLRAVERMLEPTVKVVVADTIPRAVEWIEYVDVALLDWDPMGPDLLAACEEASTPAVIYTGDIGAVPDHVHELYGVLTKPASAKELMIQLKLAVMGSMDL